MRSHHDRNAATADTPPSQRTDIQTLKRLLPYLWQYKWRVTMALLFMLGAKLANIGVPIVLKKVIDSLTFTLQTSAPSGIRSSAYSDGLLGSLAEIQSFFLLPVALVVAYGLLRLTTSLFTELRELIFSKATLGVSRSISLQVFQHLNSLSLRFHLQRQTGGLTRDIERGNQAVGSLISYSIYNIIPTLIEISLVIAFMTVQFDAGFAWIVFVALVFYILYTVSVTEWRTRYRKTMNTLDSHAQSRAIDALLNYETVKYFNNEDLELRRYENNIKNYQQAAIKSQYSLSLLNLGQQFIISTALVAILWRATQGVLQGTMTLGDLVMINAFMIQLYIPLNFLGVIYREIKQSLVDLQKMFTLLDTAPEVIDSADAQPFTSHRAPVVQFENISFFYDAPNAQGRAILQNVSFTIDAGKSVAVVGASGSGKSTLVRLLFRFYDAQQGSILIDGQDIKTLKQDDVRRAIGIVPQDTVLFNDTIAYNIGYGLSSATQQAIEQAAKAAHIHDFIVSTPAGYQTQVGERGLKLSGGEKQRVAIARTLLKNPPIMVFDEATSALDSQNERLIQAQLTLASQNKTTLIIAHRLSTIVHADTILVMKHGKIIERGTHNDLLNQHGEYARMWHLQQAQPHNTPLADT